MTVLDEAEVLEKLVAWAESRADVRAALLTSSRARPGGPVDRLSDYDMVFAATDPAGLAKSDAWLRGYGAEPVGRWGDEGELLGETTYFRSAVFADHVKIDATFWPVALLARVAEQEALPEELDEGYRVLLDKEGYTAAWDAPTHRAFIPAPPAEAAYRALVEEFWWSATYAAKALWRGEALFARWVLVAELQNNALRRMQEWRMESERGWSVRPGVLGRGLERYLPPDEAEALLAAAVGPDAGANWNALFRTVDLFRRAARDVAATLGFSYPQATDNRMIAQLEAVRALGSSPEGAPGAGGRTLPDRPGP